MDWLNFFRFDILQFIDIIKPWFLPLIWIVIPVFAFLRNTPIVGLIANRIPVFALVCLFANSIYEVFIAIFLSLFFGFFGDLLAYTKMYKYWVKLIKKIPEDSEVERYLQYYKKFPIAITVLASYSGYVSPLLAPFARRYEIAPLKFWIPRYLTHFVVLLAWGMLWYFLGTNAKQYSDVITNVGVVIIALTLLSLILNIGYVIKLFKSLKK